MKRTFIIICFLATTLKGFCQDPSTLNLNGTWEFGQTSSSLTEPVFDSSIPVPGLIHLATPRIKEYDKFFKKLAGAEAKTQQSVYEIDYTPMYSWYRRKVFIPADKTGLEAILQIKKSQYVTQVFVNGKDLGSFEQCYTPIRVQITRAIKFGQDNEIVIKVGDRYWLPSSAAGGTDKEKEHYLPGIWDDVSLNFTGKIFLTNTLLLPHLKDRKVTVKAKLWNLNHAQVFFGEQMTDTCSVDIRVRERKSGKLVAELLKQQAICMRDRNTDKEFTVDIKSPHAWSPEDPFLYVVEVTVTKNDKVSNNATKQFGMRDFERRGKFFYLNGEKLYLRGTNITLQRFFEDPECGNLAWDRKWVKKMLIDIPKTLDWNTMRICVGIAPDFWYDLADEYGLLFQNEWLYWQNHGWDDEIRKEYTDWVWTDGSHPSIVIWDGINENHDEYIGNKLIPELKRLDPTRTWDAGFMTSDAMHNDEMDEPHPYMGHEFIFDPKKTERYPLGQLSFRPEIIVKAEQSASAQLINEYGWVWLWRDGTPSKLTLPLYEKYLGANSTVDERRNFQAYWSALETEWLRSNRNFAGVLAFCYLTNNYGYTGDWFIDDIKDLKPSPTIAAFRHSFSPVNVFLDLTDERYIPQISLHKPGETLSFDCVGVNDLDGIKSGRLTLHILDARGKTLTSAVKQVTLPPKTRISMSTAIRLPSKTGGYLLLSEFLPDSGNRQVRISRRYLRVGDYKGKSFFDPEIK